MKYILEEKDIIQDIGFDEEDTLILLVGTGKKASTFPAKDITIESLEKSILKYPDTFVSIYKDLYYDCTDDEDDLKKYKPIFDDFENGLPESIRLLIEVE